MELFFYLVFVIGCLLTVGYRVRILVISYVSFSKFFVFSFHSEKGIFILPVLLLFLRGWLIGGIFYWFFVYELSFFLCVNDLFMGVLLLFGGICFYNAISFGYKLLFVLGTIFYYRWMSFGGISFLFKNLFYGKIDNSWLEMLGGRGVFSFFRRSSTFSVLVRKVSVGSLLVASFFGCFIIYFFSWNNVGFEGA